MHGFLETGTPVALTIQQKSLPFFNAKSPSKCGAKILTEEFSGEEAG